MKHYQFFRIKIILLKMNRFAKMKKERIYTLLGTLSVYSIIRDSNVASQNVARRNGMSEVDILIKYYRGVEMPHIVFRASRKNI